MHSLQNFMPKNIIVRMPNWIGDAVMATAFLQGLREIFNEARITVMCLRPIAELLTQDPHIDELFVFSKCKGLSRRDERRDIVARLQQGNYDLAIALTNSFSSAWWFWLAKIPVRLGFKAHFRSWLLSHSLNFPDNKDLKHLVDVYQYLLTIFGKSFPTHSPKLYVTASEQEEATHVLNRMGINQDHILIGINPGAAYGSAKCWLPERFSELALKLIHVSPKVRVIFFGDQAGSVLVKSICQNLPPEVSNLSGTTSLRELMTFIQKCHLFITNDSGPMHIADALGTPLIALFGSTNPITTGPYHGGRVIRKEVFCSPCYKRTCPIDFRCMTGISTEEVFHVSIAFLKSHKFL